MYELSDEQRDALKALFEDNVTAGDAAEQLHIPPAVAAKFYRNRRHNAPSGFIHAPQEKPRSPFDRERNWNARHYQSNFEPS